MLGLEPRERRLRDAVDSLERATAWMLEALAGGRAAEALAGATAYLKLFGLAQGGAALARKALAAQASLDETAGDRGHAARVVTARFARATLRLAAGLASTLTVTGIAILGSDAGSVSRTSVDAVSA